MKPITVKDLIIFGLIFIIAVMAFLLLYIQPMKNQIATNTGNVNNIINAIQGTPRQQPTQKVQPQKKPPETK